jgi:hypothetical protein
MLADQAAGTRKTIRSLVVSSMGRS